MAEQSEKNLEGRRRALQKREDEAAFAIETIPRQPEQLAYLAGLFDGEGCICVSINHYLPTTSGLSASRYTVGITISMCNREVIEWIHQLFPGSRLVPIARKKYNKNWQDAWAVSFKEATGKSFLKLIYPWLRVKKEQAALLFKFLEVKKQARFQKDSHRAELLRELQERLKSFNRHAHSGKRGPKKKNQGVVETECYAPGVCGVKFQSGLIGDSEIAPLVMGEIS